MNLQSLRKKFIGDKAFYKMLLAVFVPIVLQNGITNFVGLLDNIMVGRVGTEQMSGVSIANQLIMIFNLGIFGSISGIGIWGAQYFGQKNDEGVRQTVRMKILIAILLLGVFCLLFYFKGSELASLFLSDAGENVGDIDATLKFTKSYIDIMLIGLVPFVVVQIFASTLREAKITVLPMIASTIAVFANLFLNWVFIFGNLGAPAMGASGAAVATVISRFLECFIILAACVRTRDRLPFFNGLFRTLWVPMGAAKKILITAMPLLMNELLWSLGMAALTQSYSQRGLSAVAAYNIASTVNNFFFVFFFAVGNSIGIIVGQLLGAGKIQEAKDTDYKLLFFTSAGSFVIATALAITAPFIPQIYNTQDTVRALARDIMLVAALQMPMDALLNACYFTIRCGGKTFLTFLFDSCFCWVCSVPLAYILVTFTDLSVVWLYGLVQFANVIKLIIGLIIIKRGKWANTIVGNK